MPSSKEKLQRKAHVTVDVCLGRSWQYQTGHRTDRQCSALTALSMLRPVI